VTFDLRTIPLPDWPEDAGTWGSALIAVADQPRVVLSLPSRSHPVPWVVVDIESGETQTGRKLRGEIRDGRIDAAGEGWVLTTSAICKLTVADEPRVLEIKRPKGLGTYLWRLLELGPDHFGATGWATKSVAVISRESWTIEKRLRIPAPHLAVEHGDVVRLYSPHGGVCLDVRLPELERVGQEPMPLGTAPVVDGGELFLLHGRKRQADQAVPIEKIWQIEPDTLLALDAESLAELRRAPSPAAARDVIGVDAAGRLIVSTHRGIALVARDSLEELERVDVADRVAFHAFVPGASAVVVSPDGLAPRELVVVRWSL
jgi:hypothetical protein